MAEDSGGSAGLQQTYKDVVHCISHRPTPLAKNTYHTYLAVSDISDVRIEGLKTGDYLDNLIEREGFTEQGDAITFGSELDRVYLKTPRVVAVLDHFRRTFMISKEGLPHVVVWDPWEKKRQSLLDFGSGEYKHMVCVSAAAVKESIILKSGEHWKGRWNSWSSLRVFADQPLLVIAWTAFVAILIKRKLKSLSQLVISAVD